MTYVNGVAKIIEKKVRIGFTFRPRTRPEWLDFTRKWLLSTDFVSLCNRAKTKAPWKVFKFVPLFDKGVLTMLYDFHSKFLYHMLAV